MSELLNYAVRPDSGLQATDGAREVNEEGCGDVIIATGTTPEARSYRVRLIVDHVCSTRRVVMSSLDGVTERQVFRNDHHGSCRQVVAMLPSENGPETASHFSASRSCERGRLTEEVFGACTGDARGNEARCLQGGVRSTEMRICIWAYIPTPTIASRFQHTFAQNWVAPAKASSRHDSRQPRPSHQLEGHWCRVD